MAKQNTTSKMSLDDYDFGSEFDFEEFNFTPKPPKNKREAMERIGSGVIEGIGDAVKSPSFFRAMIKKSLPRGYGDMLDLADKSATTIRELYNEGVQEVKPAVKDLARATEKLMPSMEQYLPKTAKDTLRKFAEANRDMPKTGMDPKTMADMAVSAMMAETFKQSARREAKQDVKDNLEQTIAQDRHRDEMGQLDGIRRGVVQMAAYQRKVEYGFHRKSLELQMRHYFVAVESLNETKRQNALTTQHLAGILNNTALPDFVKMKTSEKFKDMLRNKFLNNIQQGIFGGRDNFVQRLAQAARTQVMGGLKNFAEGVSSGASGLEMMHDANSQLDDFGMDRFKLIGNQAGSMGAEWLGGMAGKAFGNRLNGSNSRLANGVKRVGNKLQYATQNAPQLLNDFSRSSVDAQTYAEKMLGRSNLPDAWKERLSRIMGAVGDPLLDAARGTVRRANATDNQVQQGGAADMAQPALFSNRAHKSLVEIIPGYLARIYQELQIARTGDTTIDLAQYDFNRNAFSTTKVVRGNVFKGLFNDGAKEGIEREKNHALDMIPGAAQLTPEQRKILGNRLMQDNLGKRPGFEAGKISNYARPGAFQSSPEEMQHADAFAKLFKNLQGNNVRQNGQLDLDFSRRFSELGRSMGDNRASVQQLLELYPRDLLESMRILKPGSNDIDTDQMARYFGGEQYDPQALVAGGGLRRDRSRSERGERARTPSLIQSGNRQYGELPQFGADNTALVEEIKKVVEAIQSQSTKGATEEIKQILLEMQEHAEHDAAGGSSLRQGASRLFGDAATRARRLQRQAQVRSGRAWQSRQQYADQARGFMGEIRDRLSPAQERLREGWEHMRAGAAQAGSRVHQGYANWQNQRTSLEGEGPSTLLTSIRDILTGIKERLDDGIFTTQASEESAGVLRRLRTSAGNVGRSARGLLGRLNFTIGDVLKGTARAARSTVGFGVDTVHGLLGGGAKLAYGLGKGAINLTTGGISKAVNAQYRRARGFVDIYVGNENRPRLYARMLQEGNTYFDQASGRPIRRLKDITGTVVKRLTDGTEAVVLEDAEIAEAWCREGIVKKSLKSVGVVLKTARDITAKTGQMLLGGLPMAYRVGLMGAKKAWSLLDMAQDVFVKDRLDEPALTARLMRAGSYHSAVSGNTITRPSQIDGPVIIGNGESAETVLTHDDIRKGLVDKNNKPLRTGLRKLLGLAGDLTGKVFGLGRKGLNLATRAVKGVIKSGVNAGKKLADAAVGLGGAGFDILRGRLPWGAGGGAASNEATKKLISTGNQTNLFLKQIRDMLDERLPGKKKHASWDADGDGDRDGSYEDQMQNKKATEASQAAAAASNAPNRSAGGGGLLAGAKGLWDKLRGKKDGEEDGVNVELDADGKPKRRPRRGKGFKQTKGVWNKTKWLGKAAGRGLLGVGKFAARNAGSLLGLGGLGLGGLLAGAGSAIAAGASAVAGAAATVGTAIAGVLTAPVLIGAAAIAAIGVAGYYGYKYLTKRRLGLLSRIRYVQYGFGPKDDEHVGAVFGLEDKLKSAVVFGKEGAKIDAAKVNAKELIKEFGISEDDTVGMNKWLAWLQGRFKPVFLTHVTALRGIAGDKWLSDVDSLEASKQVAYFNAVKFPNGPYGLSTSPFKDLKELPSKAGDVAALIELVGVEIKKLSKSTGQAAGLMATGVVTGIGAAATSAAVVQRASTDSIKPNRINDITKLSAVTSGMSNMGSKTTLYGSGMVLESLGVNRLDAIDVVRMKSYGLVKMELDKVKSVKLLEKDVAKQLMFSGGDKGSVANWSGSLEQVVKTNAPSFGVDPSNEDQARQWLLWFNKRFLPVYLNFATLIKAQTGRTNPDEGKDLLKPNQQLELATALYTTSNRANGGMDSVWLVSESPWPDYTLNNDVRSVDANLQGLKEMAKNTVLAEPGTAAPGTMASPNKTPIPPPSQSMLGSLWAKTKSFFGGESNTGYSGGPAVGGGAGTAGGLPSSFEGAREMRHVGKGTGGDINAIPLPKGNKSWAAVKDTILGAANMVGVDPKLMAAMAAIESGFDHTVRSSSSSATGLYQFVDGTWAAMMKMYAGKYGIAPNTPPTDARANALLGAQYIKDNIEVLQKKLNRPLTDTDIYFAHFLGSGGASKFLSADPNAIAANMMPKEARANQSIFYRNNVPLTVGQVYQVMNNRLKGRAKDFGINDGGEEMTVSKATPAAVAALAAGAAGGKASETITGKVEPAKAAKTASVQGIGAVVAATPSTDASNPTPAPEKKPVGGALAIGAPAGMTSTPRAMADVARQQQLAAEVRVSNLSSTNEILSKQLEWAEKTHGALISIAKILSGKSTPPESATVTSQQARVEPRQVQDLPRAPVSVAKPTSPYGRG